MSHALNSTSMWHASHAAPNHLYLSVNIMTHLKWKYISFVAVLDISTQVVMTVGRQHVYHSIKEQRLDPRISDMGKSRGESAAGAPTATATHTHLRKCE